MEKEVLRTYLEQDGEAVLFTFAGQQQEFNKVLRKMPEEGIPDGIFERKREEKCEEKCERPYTGTPLSKLIAVALLFGSCASISSQWTYTEFKSMTALGRFPDLLDNSNADCRNHRSNNITCLSSTRRLLLIVFKQNAYK